MNETTIMLAPIGNMKYLHRRKETDLKDIVVNPKRDVSTEVQLIAHHVQKEERKRKGDGIAGGMVSPPN
ncbi:hypothetical protein ACHAWF_005542 [Thalassiosira exigua]